MKKGFKKSKNGGFTLVELLLSLCVIILLSYAVVNGFKSFRGNQGLDKTSNRIVTLLQKARYQTLSSKGNLRYGVHFASDQAALFATAYATGTAGNEVYLFDPFLKLSLIGIKATTTQASTTDVMFTKFTGESSATGTLKFSLVSSTTPTYTVILYVTGLIESN